MKREFLINIIFLLGINLLIKPFYIFGIDRTVQNMVAPGVYGIYFTLYNFTYLFQIINDFGIQNFNNRNIAQYRQLIHKYFPNILILKGLLGVLYLLAILIAGILVGYTPFLKLMMLIGFNWLLNALVLYLRSNISGLGLYRLDSLVSVLDKLLLILVCSILLWANPWQEAFRIEWFVYAQTFSLSITAAIAFMIVLPRLTRLRFRFQPAFLWLTLKRSYPYALVIFLMTAYTRIDSVMIERMLPDGPLEADLYASAYRLLDASNMIGFLFAGLLLPMFARLIKEQGDFAELAQTSLQFIWVGAITLCCVCWFFQEDIMVLLYNNGSAYSGKILAYLMLSFVAISGSYIFGTLLTANGSMMQMNRLFVVGLLLNLLLNILLIPTQKALGAAIATCATQFFVLIGQIVLARQLLKVQIKIPAWLRLVGFSICICLSTWLISHFFPTNWIVNFLLSITAAIPLAFLFQLMDISQLSRQAFSKP
ncbi:MAG: hypothetical protein DHS20C18_48240 [Saprospiraceae bacterium]|nr:MAG: hypothetical protein DHS20C18_48240 [Saprospiraceae bacterium]